MCIRDRAYDRNQVSQDDIFQPGFWIEKHAQKMIASKEKRQAVYVASDNQTSLSHRHYLPTATRWPGNYQLESEVIANAAVGVSEFLKILGSEKAFNRLAVEGVEEPWSGTTSWDYAELMAQMVKSIKSGRPDLMPNLMPVLSLPATITLQAFLAYLQTGNEVVYEIAGMTMAKYAKDEAFIRKYDEIVELMSKRGMTKVPLQTIILPSAEFQIATIERFRPMADNLVQLAVEIIDTQAANRQNLAGLVLTNEERKKLLKESDLSLRVSKNQIRELAFCLAKPYEKAWDVFFSQYDLIRLGENLYFPEALHSMPYEKMRQVNLYLRGLQLERNLALVSQ